MRAKNQRKPLYFDCSSTDKKIKILLIFVFTITATFHSFGQSDKKLSNDSLIQITTPATFRLFPTQNMWTFLKLNTRNGQIWQVQFDIQGNNRSVLTVNWLSLVDPEDESDDRFTLYPTQNIYTFLLLDHVRGKTWQVQWSREIKNRGIIPIE